jgi:hydrogenase expression/formation protein HypC
MKVVTRAGPEGMVSTGALRRKVNFSFLKAARKGDYVLVHAGFAIGKIDPKEAKKTLKLLKEIL